MKDKMTNADFVKAAEALRKANVPGEKLVIISRGLFEETEAGTLWHKV